MLRHKTAYELSESQVTTPESVVDLFWRFTKQRRSRLSSVLDLGAGDCRFARGGVFEKYVGIEIDPKRSRTADLPTNGHMINTCAFRHRGRDFDACIGNPPYVRHHDIENSWKEMAAARIKKHLGVALDKHCNLYLYFLCLALLKTHSDGLVALLIPYEWVSRPSAHAVREYIRGHGWDVAVYRFQKPVFKGVLTTASISIVDKRSHEGRWRYYDISPEFQVIPRQGPADGSAGVLDYAQRGFAWALRGLSPGSQKVFTLTEGERVHCGLKKRDVVPCVTTLRDIPRSLKSLTRLSFNRHFVFAGRRCWLIKSYSKTLSPTLKAYLDSIPMSRRDTFTCLHQRPWFNYRPHPVPQVLVGSGFTTLGPKVLINSVGAVAVGSVWGVHAKSKLPVRRLQRYLLSMDLEKRIVAHARTLKKVEVRQLNGVLNTFTGQERPNGRIRTR